MNIMIFKLCSIFYVFQFTCLQQITSGSKCFPCEKPLAGYDLCGKGQTVKKVDFSGLCAIGTACTHSLKNCSHQIKRNGSECQFRLGSDCSADSVGSWPILQCDGSSGECSCPAPAYGHVALEDHVVITAYPFECSCAITNQYVSAPDIRVTNNGWGELAIVSNSSQGKRSCGRFSVAAGASGGRVQYDCPRYSQVEEGKAISLQLCTRHHTVSYRFRLPNRTHISVMTLNVSTWEPVIAVHMHRADLLVYSVQRSPPSLNITQYTVQLVRCEALDCSRFRTVPGTERHIQEMPSASALEPGVFKLQFGMPADAGYISLRVLPKDGLPTLSVVILHPGTNVAQVAIFVSILALVLVCIIAALVWFKFFYTPTEPAEVEVLVLYNSNAGLARHVARMLEKHCLVKTKLDVEDIPRASAGMDPAEWLYSELQRCQTVLLLVFPENKAPPIYPRLYPTAVHLLSMDAGRKSVVIGSAGGGDCAPLPKLPAARLCRLPEQLDDLVRAVRGALWPGKGYLDARELARRLTASKGGHALAAMLEKPADLVAPPEMAPLPVDDAPPPLPPLPTAPPRHEDKLAPHILSTNDVLLDLPPNRQDRPSDDADDSDDLDIEWH